LSKETWALTATVILGIILVFSVKYIFPLVAPFFLGAVFACLVEPSVRFLEERVGIHRKFAVILIITIFIGMMMAVLVITLMLLYKEAQASLAQLSRLGQQLVVVERELSAWIRRIFPEMKMNGSFLWLRESLDHLIRYVVNGGLNLASLLPRFLLWIGLRGITAYFFIRDKKDLIALFVTLVPQRWQPYLLPLKREMIEGLARFIRTEFILVMHTTLVTAIVFFLLGWPGAWAYGLLAGVLDIIPVLGPGFIYFPAVGIAMLFHQYQGALGCIIGYFLLLASRQWIEVKLLGSNLQFHPLLVMITIYVGMKLFGISGVFFGPFILAVLRGSYRALRNS